MTQDDLVLAMLAACQANGYDDNALGLIDRQLRGEQRQNDCTADGTFGNCCIWNEVVWDPRGCMVIFVKTLYGVMCAT